MFVVGLDVRNFFDRSKSGQNLLIQAESDWEIATSHLAHQSPNYGQARWSTLQFSEKMMKWMIKRLTKNTPPHTHDLSKLIKLLESYSFAASLKPLLPSIQCSAELRYGEAPSSRQEAYEAYKSSLLLARAIGEALS